MMARKGSIWNRPLSTLGRGERIRLVLIVLSPVILVFAGIAVFVVVQIRNAVPAQLVKALGPACRGEPVPVAADATGSAPWRIIVLDGAGHVIGTGGTNSWTNEVAQWRATKVENAALVACVDREDVLIETCTYTGGTGVKRYADHAHVRVMAARTGEQVDVFDLSADPANCSEKIGVASAIDLHGSLNFATLSARLATYATP
jgi:hypothetical protein